jgi:hypothetical protein
LTPEDDLFGRVALFNNLITLDQIVECARAINTEILAGRPRRTLARMLITKKYLTTAQAGAVEEAIRKRAADSGRAAVTAGPTPKPRPMDAPAPSGESQIALAIIDEVGEKEEVSEERMREIVTQVSPGRIFPEMLDHIVRTRSGVINIRALAKAISEPEKQVSKALEHWRRIKLVRSQASYPYCYSPSDKLKEDIRIFLEAWHNPRKHPRILGYILECE